MKNTIRTHHCGELRKEDIGKKIKLAGWVHRRRDHGGLIFIDLRDFGGLTQIVFDPKINKNIHENAHRLRSEWVIGIDGEVILRAEGMINPKMDTGEIEIKVTHLTIYSEAKTPPFSICDELIDVREDLKLKYRYLDMRRGRINENLKMRHKMMLETRNFLDSKGFCEVSTPILCKSTPEGARDYLVPSRIYPGQFYALPQSPQMFKQILMIGGFDKYFQIAQCFRDEDLRADRQPEFTQIDIEMSFESIDHLFSMIESLFISLYKTFYNKKIDVPFQKLTYKECMDDYGTDKPDLRIPIKLKDMSAIAKKSDFSVFLNQLEVGGVIKGMRIPGGGDISRKLIDQYTVFVSQFGIKGLAWMKMNEGKLSSNIVKFFDEALQQEMIELFELEDNDILFILASSESKVNQGLDHLRRHIARERDLIDRDQPALLWVTDFPLFVYNDEHQLEATHHPFTSPHLDDLDLLDSDPVSVRSLSYDLVLNGYELASGSVRIHDSQIQEKIFSLLKLSPEDIEKKFGFFVEALGYGTPPHLGIALGVDRMMMIFLDTENIRDVIAFPKTQKASDLMSEAPSEVESSQLEELKINLET